MNSGWPSGADARTFSIAATSYIQWMGWAGGGGERGGETLLCAIYVWKCCRHQRQVEPHAICMAEL